jgi:hypothetical protein
MRAIDMLCLMLSPVAAGFLMTYAGMLPAVAVVFVYSAVAWLPECILLRVAVQLSPELARPRSTPATAPAAAAAGRGGGGDSAAGAKQQQPRSAGIKVPFAALFTGWSVYWRQPTLLPALALACLYLTCLSLGFLMTAFLRFNGMSEVRGLVQF